MKLLRLPWDELDQEGRTFFAYDLDRLQAIAIGLKKSFSSFSNDTEVLFSLKSNPHPKVIESLAKLIDGFDVSSELELKLCRRLGVSGSKLSVSGPGKTTACLKLAREMGVAAVHVDSLDELAVAQELGLGRLSFRIHTPDVFSVKLGLGPEDLERALNGLQAPALGLHLYLGRESFRWERLLEAAQTMESYFSRFPNSFRDGGRMYLGPGVPGGVIPENFTGPRSSRPAIFELGRALIADCAWYGVPVLSRKHLDRGGEALVVHGGLQHLGSPFVTFAQRVSEVNAVVVRGGRTLEEETSEFLVAGSLCLGHDILHPRLRLPRNIGRGDWIIFPRAGAYGLTAGVPFFIGQDLPKEIFFENGVMNDRTLQDFRPYHECF